METPPVSWLGGILLGPAFPPRCRVFRRSTEAVARARLLPPYSRAAATAFHRLPVHGVSL